MERKIVISSLEEMCDLMCGVIEDDDYEDIIEENIKDKEEE